VPEEGASEGFSWWPHDKKEKKMNPEQSAKRTLSQSRGFTTIRRGQIEKTQLKMNGRTGLRITKNGGRVTMNARVGGLKS